MRLITLLAGILLFSVPAQGQQARDESESTLALFEKRILPIFRAEKPSSCAECHLSGVDLKDYIRPSQEATFAALLRGGLIDRQRPDESKLLAFISRKPEKPSIVTDQVRQQEYEAFRAWIRAAANDPQLLEAKAGGDSLGPQVPEEVIRHARRDRVLGSFLENVWSEMTRCEHCHSPDFNRGHIARHGQELVDRISWIVPRDPEATLRRLVDSRLVDLDDPAKSKLLTKPTLQVEHQGGIKMVVGDRSYVQFRRFVEDYAASAKGAYKSADQLPKPTGEVAVLSNLFLRIDDLPERFGRRVMQVEVYPWDAKRKAWSDECCASGVWFVTLGRFWQSPLHLTAHRGSERAKALESKQLPAGRYLARLHLDKKGQLQRKEAAALTETELVGEVAFESQWPGGFANKTAIRFPAVAENR